MKHKSAQTLLAVLFGTGFYAAELHAQNTFFETGDLILYFQKPGEDGTIFVGLGSAATLYRGTAAGPTADRQALNIVNINAALTAAYGASWATDTGIYAGVAGCRSSEFGEDVFDGDQTRTLYISRARNGVGTVGQQNSTTWNLNQAQTQTTGASSIVGSLSNDFETNHLTRVATAPASASTIDDTNPFTNVGSGIQGAAFNGAFAGGVQHRGSAASFGTFGPAGSVEFALDLSRIVPQLDSATVGEVSGVKLVGSYEGTIVVGTDGNVSFITQGVASAYTAWATTNGVTGQAANLDHDNDGVSNGVEYFLVGPSTVSTGFTSLPGVTVDKSVTWTKAGTYTGVYGTDFWVETSTSLATGSWTNATLGVNVVITGNNVKYTFPSGPVKTFARLKVTGP